MFKRKEGSVEERNLLMIRRRRKFHMKTFLNNSWTMTGSRMREQQTATDSRKLMFPLQSDGPIEGRKYLVIFMSKREILHLAVSAYSS